MINKHQKHKHKIENKHSVIRIKLKKLLLYYQVRFGLDRIRSELEPKPVKQIREPNHLGLFLGFQNRNRTGSTKKRTEPTGFSVPSDFSDSPIYYDFNPRCTRRVLHFEV